jgi:predicted transcriptional regulator
VENNGKLEGYISIENIPQDVNYDETVETVMLQDVPIIPSNKSLHDALNMIVNESTGKLVVVDNNEMDKILGTLTLSEISEAYNREIRRIKERTRPLKSRPL